MCCTHPLASDAAAPDCGHLGQADDFQTLRRSAVALLIRYYAQGCSRLAGAMGWRGQTKGFEVEALNAHESTA
jgi:hypothetical protein